MIITNHNNLLQLSAAHDLDLSLMKQISQHYLQLCTTTTQPYLNQQDTWVVTVHPTLLHSIPYISTTLTTKAKILISLMIF